MKISIIVAFGKEYQIGLDNKLLWHIPEDLKNFKRLTNGHHILMGRKTFESIGKPLPNRTSVVLSKNGFEQEGVHTFPEFQEALNFCRSNGEEEVFIIGGAQIYKQALPFADKLYLSFIDYNKEADAFFPKVDFSKWELMEEKEYLGEGEIPKWDFRVYTKKD